MTPGSPRWWRELGLEPPPVRLAPATAAVLPATMQSDPAPGRNASARPAPPSAARPERSVPGPAPAAQPPLAQPANADPQRSARIAALDWEDLHASIADCSACALRGGRRHAVPGVGDRAARWLFVGEAPGAEEDARGEPFVGAAGQLLDAMLSALGLRRDHQVFIANVVKCRPPANRTPELAECASCLPYLERQIALIQPAVIVALGRVAAQTLLASQLNVGSLRGKVHDYAGIPLVVSYHPAYLLRNLTEKSRAWVDLCLAQRVLAERESASAPAQPG